MIRSFGIFTLGELFTLNHRISAQFFIVKAIHEGYGDLFGFRSYNSEIVFSEETYYLSRRATNLAKVVNRTCCRIYFIERSATGVKYLRPIHCIGVVIPRHGLHVVVRYTGSTNRSCDCGI